MDKHTILEISKISRLISYDRSKTLFEQESSAESKFDINSDQIIPPDELQKTICSEKGSRGTPAQPIQIKGSNLPTVSEPQVYKLPYRGTIHSPNHPEEHGQPFYLYDVTGKEFNYPDYCDRPDLAVTSSRGNATKGTTVAISNYCIYKTPGKDAGASRYSSDGGFKYFPSQTIIIETFSDSAQENYDWILNSRTDFTANGTHTFDLKAYKTQRGLMSNSRTFSWDTIDSLLKNMGKAINPVWENKERCALYSLAEKLSSDMIKVIEIDGNQYIATFGWENIYKSYVSTDMEQYNYHPLVIWWEFKGYLDPYENVYYPGVKIEDKYVPFEFSLLEIFDEVASFLCGDNSPAAGWFEIPWLEYPSEELLCDIASGVLMAFGPVGIAASLFIEGAHSRDLYNKGDYLGSGISLILGMIPLFGDGAAILTRSLLRKAGKTSFTKVLEAFTIGLKVVSGEIGATRIRAALKTLNKEEREILYRLWATSTHFIGDAAKTVKKTLEEMIDIISIFPGSDDYVKSLTKALDVVGGAGITSKMIDFASQQLSIFTLILAPRVFVELGIAEDDLSFESQEELYEYMIEHPEDFVEN